MRTGNRRAEILRQLFLTGYVEAKELAERFEVDTSTIRRDLDALAGAGHLERTHGGARPHSGAVDIPYAVKEREQTTAKRAIAQRALALIGDGDSILLDSGSTTYELAVALRTRRDLTIVTNDLRIGLLVAEYPGIHLLLTGGELLGSTFTLIGERAVDFVEDLRVDWTFLGADAVDSEAGVTNTNTIEIPLKHAMIAVGRTVVVLADSTKFGQRALVRVADLDQVHYLITDPALSADQSTAYGDRLLIAAIQRSDGTPPVVTEVP